MGPDICPGKVAQVFLKAQQRQGSAQPRLGWSPVAWQFRPQREPAQEALCPMPLPTTFGGQPVDQTATSGTRNKYICIRFAQTQVPSKGNNG